MEMVGSPAAGTACGLEVEVSFDLLSQLQPGLVLRVGVGLIGFGAWIRDRDDNSC